MSINLNTNFKIPANIPIDSRFVFETITDMNNLASNDPKSLYNGLISYVKENSTFYRFYKDETSPGSAGNFTKILDEHGLRFYRNAVNIKTDLNAYNSDSEEGSLVFVKKEQQFYVRTKEIGSDGNPTGNLIWKELIDPNNFTGTIEFSEPTTLDVGGIPKGTVYSGSSKIRIEQLIYNLLHPYVEPSIFLETNQEAKVYPNDETVYLNYIKATSSGGSVNAFKDKDIEVNITITKYDQSIKDYVSNTETLNLSDTSEFTVTYGTDGEFVKIDFTNPRTYNESVGDIKIELTTKVDTSYSITKSVEFRFIPPIYAFTGKDTLSTLIKGGTLEATIKSSTTNVLYEDAYTLDLIFSIKQGYHTFAYPAARGSLKKIIDENNFDITNSYVKATETINGQSYMVYQSENIATLDKFKITLVFEGGK